MNELEIIRSKIYEIRGQKIILDFDEEFSRCQIGILKSGRGGNFKYLPFAFTELGVAMLSSDIAGTIMT